ncbi:MAG: tyrosine-type recombinase/integrase [Bacillus sp. (in: firmicutes)]
MLNKDLQHAITYEKKQEIENILEGPFSSDKWDMLDPFFKNYRIVNFETTRRSRYLDFSIWNFNIDLKLEVKYYYAKNILDNNFSLTTALTTFQRTKHLARFIKNYNPHIQSLLEIDIQKCIIKIRAYLTELGLKSSTKQKSDFEAIHDFKRIYNYLFVNFDTRDEYDKDKWDIRKLPNVIYNGTELHFTISFGLIPSEFKPLIKRYLKSRLKTKTFGTVLGDSHYLTDFIQFIFSNHPQWYDLKELNRNDIEKYLDRLHKIKDSTTLDYRSKKLSAIYGFLQYIQIAKYPEAPIEHYYHLIYKEDIPKRARTINRIKYIPEYILNQLIEILSSNPSDLNPPMSNNDRAYIPIVIMLMETGFRISDVLNLRYDKCLLKTEDQWYLKGDIQKTQVKDHIIPITEEVAEIVQTLIEIRKENAQIEHNPDKYLFVRTYGPRMGLPMSSASVQNTLNRWANTYNIVSEDRNVYHFKNHAFRHTKAVELINNGMSLLTLQKFMAHCSPEMTMIYARITDPTMKKEWQKAQENRGPLLQINIATGEVKEADTDVIQWERVRHNLEAAKVPMGYCMVSKNMGCPYVETPCLSCNNFCTTPENLPEFDLEIQHTEQLVERTIDMAIWNEKNQKRLDQLKNIRTTLAQGLIHHPAGKKRREYT